VAGRPIHTFAVVRSEQLTPHMIRVVLGGGFTTFTPTDFTDSYVKIVLPRSGTDVSTLPTPLTLDSFKELPDEYQPVVRTYTVRKVDRERGEISIDFVVHGEHGVAGPWAASVKPGDPAYLMGPSGAYAPDPAADWHLLAGDESAVPAITAALEALPADAVARVVVLVEDADHEPALPLPAGAELTVLHRATLAPGEGLAATVRALEWLPGRVHAFVHGEAEEVMHGVRPYLLKELRLSRDQVSISGYWRRGRSEEGFRSWKAELRAAEDA